MEFWGVEVKAGEVLKVKPESDKLIHISQASLGEVKDVKGAKNVPLRFKINDKDFVFGFLGGEDKTQLILDLVFEKEFELSHGWKNGSVYFLGYTAVDPVSDEEIFSDMSDSEDEMIEADENGLAKPKLENLKPAAGNKKTEKPGTVDEDDNDSESDADDSLSSDSDDEDEDDSEEEKEAELPKVKPTKKRAAEQPTQKNSAPAKKAKPDNKVAIPSKPAAGKASAGGNKFKGQKPKSGGGNRGRK